MKKEVNPEGVVSIIIPVYNTGKYLKKCLDSVCGQSYSRLEIIVVNDGSTDESGIILQEYLEADSRIQVISQKNKGLSFARNTGLEHSSGEYVIFLDSDDWLDEMTIEKSIEMLIETEADVVLWSYVREYSNTSKSVQLFKEDTRVWDEIKIKMLYQQLIGPRGKQCSTPQRIDSLVTAWGKLYKRYIIGDVRFVDTKIIGTEDALFNILVFSKVKRASYISNTFSHYRKTNSNSLTKKYKTQLVYQWIELYRRIRLHLDTESVSIEYYQALSNRIAFGLIGIGLNLAEDSRLSFVHKRQELLKILKMPHYRRSLQNLSLEYLPIYWKVFFLCAKYKASYLLCLLLLFINKLRSY